MDEGTHDELNEPLVIASYLDVEEGILTAEFLDELLECGDLKTLKRLRRYLIKAWGQGRSHGEVNEYHRVFEDQENKIKNTEIATKLHLTSAAVGDWFNEKKGVEAENLVLLRRFYRDLLSIAQPTEHEIDLSGFVRAVSQLQTLQDAEQRRLDEIDFLRLWFLYRNETWREAVETESPELKDIARSEINRRVRRSAKGLFELRLDRRTKYLSDPKINEFKYVEASLARLEELAQSWGSSFVAVIEYLETICWTRPNDS